MEHCSTRALLGKPRAARSVPAISHHQIYLVSIGILSPPASLFDRLAVCPSDGVDVECTPTPLIQGNFVEHCSARFPLGKPRAARSVPSMGLVVDSCVAVSIGKKAMEGMGMEFKRVL